MKDCDKNPIFEKCNCAKECIACSKLLYKLYSLRFIFFILLLEHQESVLMGSEKQSL